MNDINGRIKQLRKLKGLSQKEFGKSINLSQNHISSIEKGIRTITKRSIDDICRIYNVNPNWLLSGRGDIFVNELDKFNVEDKDIKEFAEMFLQLDEETQDLISKLMKKALNK